MEEQLDETQLEILSIIRSSDKKEDIQEKLDHYHESDIAGILPLLSTAERKKLYLILGKEKTSEVFTYLNDVDQYIEELENETAADIIELMDADDAVDVLQELNEQDKKDIVNLMEKDAVADVKLIASYDEDQIGSKMTTNYIIVHKTDSVKEAMRHLIKYSKDNDNIMTLFVRDEEGKFYGSIDLTDLIIARDTQPLTDIIHTSYPTVHATENVSECINDLKDAALDLYPVLNDKDELIGVITPDDLVEVVHDEMSDDYAKLAGLNESEEIDESVGKSVKKRIVWLLVLLVLGMVISVIISQFEAVIQVIPMIVFFQSAILDMSGNAGTQSLAVTIRALMDENLDRKKTAKLIWKEVRIGFTNGILLAVVSFAAVFAFLAIRHAPITGDVFTYKDALLISASVSGALVPALTLSSLTGTTIPVLFKKIHIDPAVASGPLITTLNDVVAVVCYYGLAMLMFAAVIG